MSERKDVTDIFYIVHGSRYLVSDPTMHISREQFKESLQKLVNIFNNMGKRVWIVKENPELVGLSLDSCKGYPPFKGRDLACAISVEDVMIHQKEYRHMIKYLKNVSLIETLDAFCQKGRCRVFDKDGTSLYGDTHHLSVAGSRFQAEFVLKPYLEKIAKEYMREPVIENK